MSRELAEARGKEDPKSKTTNDEAFTLASDRLAADFEAWAARAGIVAPKLRIADFDGERRSRARGGIGLMREGEGAGVRGVGIWIR